MLCKYKTSFNLLHTLQNFVIFTSTSSYEKGEPALTPVEKRRGMLSGHNDNS